MSDYSMTSTALIVRRPIHPLLFPFPAACFAAALLTDIAYWRTAEMLWSDFSAWLISAGVILGIIVLIVALVDLLTGRLSRIAMPVWPYLIGHVVVLILAIVNMLIHTRDAWTSVVPWGLALSAATVLALLLTIWAGWALFSRREVAIVTREVDIEVVTP